MAAFTAIGILDRDITEASGQLSPKAGLPAQTGRVFKVKNTFLDFGEDGNEKELEEFPEVTMRRQVSEPISPNSKKQIYLDDFSDEESNEPLWLGSDSDEDRLPCEAYQRFQAGAITQAVPFTMQALFQHPAAGIRHCHPPAPMQQHHPCQPVLSYTAMPHPHQQPEIMATAAWGIQGSGAVASAKHSRVQTRQQRSPQLPPPPGWDPTATTVMIRNLPNKYTQQMLLRTLQDSGFRPCSHFDFFYLPMDRGNGANLGYGFVNFVDPVTAGAFASTFQGRRMRRFNSRKTIDVMPALIQGYEANREHYAGTRVVHSDDHQCRPLFLRDGGAALAVVNQALATAPPAPLLEAAVPDDRRSRGQREANQTAGREPAEGDEADASPSRRRRRGGGRRGGRSKKGGAADDKADVIDDLGLMEDRGVSTASTVASSAAGSDVAGSGGTVWSRRPSGSASGSDKAAAKCLPQLDEWDLELGTPERQQSATQEPLQPPMAFGLMHGPLSPVAASHHSVESSPMAAQRCFQCPNCGSAYPAFHMFCPYCTGAMVMQPR